MPEDNTEELHLDSVLYSTDGDGLPFAFRRGEVITTQPRRAKVVLDALEEDQAFPGQSPRELLFEAFDPQAGEVEGQKVTDPGGPNDADRSGPDFHPDAQGPFYLVSNVTDPLRGVLELRLRGIVAQPNYVYFSHAGGGYPWPVTADGADLDASPVYASPVYASPVYASPVYASPVYASPVYASPVYASPVSGTDAVRHTSSAVPAMTGHTTGAAASALEVPLHPGARIYVLDTGLAAAGQVSTAFGDRMQTSGAIRPLRPSDASDMPTRSPGGGYLAPAAGHGTFIATLIAQVAPGCGVLVGKVLSNSGVGDEWRIAKRIGAVADDVASSGEPSVLSLSFGAPVLDHPHLLSHVVKRVQANRALVVASAGNDAMRRPVFPAALAGVVGVGALGTSGPAPFTNHGPWVSACAPGVDLVSGFFKWKGHDHLEFDDWAIWSGTSFSAPLVAATLARLVLTAPVMLGHPVSVAGARHRVIDSPWLYRIPDLGTVVNVV